MAERARTRTRLDQPSERRRRPLRSRGAGDRLGRFSERFARFMGTATFLAWMTIVVAVWISWNSAWGPDRPRWDEYPFIFLTLILSLQASYAAPLILLAQNRQEARDRVQYERDRDVDARTRADMEFLAREMASLRMAVGEVATRDFLRSELRSLLSDLDERADRSDQGDRSEEVTGATPTTPGVQGGTN